MAKREYRIALTNRVETAVVFGSAVVCAALLVLLLDMPFEGGKTGWAHPVNWVGAALLIALLAGLSVVFWYDYRRRKGRCFRWDGDAMWVEKRSQADWRVEWSTYAGFDYPTKPNCRQMAFEIRTRSSDNRALLVLPGIQPPREILRLLALAAPDDAGLPAPRARERPRASSYRAATAVGLLVTIAGTIAWLRWNPGTDSGVVGFTMAVGLSVGPPVLILALIGAAAACFRREKPTPAPPPTRPNWTFADTLAFGWVPGSPGPRAVYSYRDSEDFGWRVRLAKRQIRTLAILPCLLGVGLSIFFWGLSPRDSGNMAMSVLFAMVVVAVVSAIIWLTGVISSFEGSEAYSVEWDEGEFYVHFEGRRAVAQVLRAPNTPGAAVCDDLCRLTLGSEFGILNFAPQWMRAQPTGRPFEN